MVREFREFAQSADRSRERAALFLLTLACVLLRLAFEKRAWLTNAVRGVVGADTGVVLLRLGDDDDTFLSLVLWSLVGGSLVL